MPQVRARSLGANLGLETHALVRLRLGFLDLGLSTPIRFPRCQIPAGRSGESLPSAEALG